MLREYQRNILASGLIAGSVIANSDMASAQTMTAGVVLEKMENRELGGFISGVIEGLAYARFRKDTLAAGSKDERGMNCIYNWYYASNDQPAGILATFQKYPERMPGVIIALMVKQECGE